MSNTDFPNSLFDERIMRKPFDLADTDVADTQAEFSMGTDFVGEPNPDYDFDYIPPNDSIPF